VALRYEQGEIDQKGSLRISAMFVERALVPYEHPGEISQLLTSLGRRSSNVHLWSLFNPAKKIQHSLVQHSFSPKTRSRWHPKTSSELYTRQYRFVAKDDVVVERAADQNLIAPQFGVFAACARRHYDPQYSERDAHST